MVCKFENIHRKHRFCCAGSTEGIQAVVVTSNVIFVDLTVGVSDKLGRCVNKWFSMKEGLDEFDVKSKLDVVEG